MTQKYTRSKDASVLVAPPPHKRQQVVRHLRTLINSLVPGDRLPSVSDLERQLGVARKTVVAALEQLQAEGVIDARPRSGTFVAERGGAALVSPQATANAVALFAFRPTDYYLSWINHFVVQAGAMGLDVDCQYTFGPLEEGRIAKSLASSPLGAITLSTTQPELIRYIRDAGHRVVVISEPRLDDELLAPYVCSDAEQGGYIATRHLLDIGHRRIGYVHWMPDDRDLLARWRWRGHARALREAGLPEPPRIIGAERFASWREYSEVLRYDLMQSDAPTALLAWSDLEAAELVGAIRRAGLSVPNDISVVGYDNLPRSVEGDPRLTTVDQDMKTLARRALSLLMNPDAYEEVRLAQAARAEAGFLAPACTPHLILRESTAEYKEVKENAERPETVSAE